jgi:hypothetical protein
MPAGMWKMQLHTFFSMVQGRGDRPGARSGHLYPEVTTAFTHRIQARLGLVEEKNLPVQGI